MKVIGIIGYKKRGKTTLGIEIARELRRRGLKVGVVKHSEGTLDLPNTDTGKYKEVSPEVAFISPGETAIFLKGEKGLEEIINYLKGDYLVVEGFKENKTFPKILCLEDKKEAKDLLNGLEIGVVGAKNALPLPYLKDIKEIVDLVEARAFKLPGLDCQGCGYKNCYELAQEIVKGNKKEEDCVSLSPETQVRIEGREVPLNPFIADMIRNTIQGLLSSLKGYRPGDMEIVIKKKGG